jgi:hypothetical protein
MPVPFPWRTILVVLKRLLVTVFVRHLAINEDLPFILPKPVVDIWFKSALKEGRATSGEVTELDYQSCQLVL